MSKILLVAGHGAGDPGAASGGINERDTMRALAREIKALIPDVVDVYDMTRDMFQDTNRGGGMSSTAYKEVIELHMDASKNELVKGGHAIIYISYNPDDLDKRLVKTIDECFGIVPYLRPSGISKRNNLLNLNVAAKRGISYRLLELGFITNADNRKAVTGEQLKVTARKLAEAITNKKLSTTTTTVEGKQMDKLLGKTQQDDMRNLLQRAYKRGIFTKDHSPSVAKMTRGEALDLLISYTARTTK
ncbi:MAG TPA: N-acetylmuramoyl-L-alanine amidase [Metalysinibacillus sp.]